MCGVTKKCETCMDRLEALAGMGEFEELGSLGGNGLSIAGLGEIIPTFDINQFPVQNATTIFADTVFSNPLVDRLLVLGLDKVFKDPTKNPLRGEYAHLWLMLGKGLTGGMMSLSRSSFWKGMGTGFIGGATNNGIAFAEKQFLKDVDLPNVGIDGIMSNMKYHQVADHLIESVNDDVNMDDYYQYFDNKFPEDMHISNTDEYDDDDLAPYVDMTL